MSNSYSVTVGGTQVYAVDGNNVNGEAIVADILKLDNRFYHILTNGKSYNVEVVSIDNASKTMSLIVNGHKFSISLRDKFDQMMEQMGFNAASGSRASDLKAPMPGLVLDIRVRAGDTVQKGDPLIVLEAMKMENVLKSPGDGTVSSIAVEKGASVEKGTLLVAFQ